MNLNRYQTLAARTLSLNATKTPLTLEQCALELASEAGEAIGEIKRLNRILTGSEYRPGVLTPEELKARIVDEIGDVLWAVAAIATRLDVPLQVVASGNIYKLLSRAPEAFAGASLGEE
jgi:NTP pyrophosphatase (non-canonical NTP hydrolase)